MRLFFGVVGALSVVALPMFSQSAEARIKCDGRYQVVRGEGQIASPYCEDNYLAQVAIRSYGVSTSASRIRSSVSEKERVCRVMGFDSRVNDICLEYRDDRGNRFRP